MRNIFGEIFDGIKLFQPCWKCETLGKRNNRNIFTFFIIVMSRKATTAGNLKDF